MKRMMTTFAAVAAFGAAFAQNAVAPAPETTSQEKCAIEEKDVDAMMDEYISSKGWVEGLNTKADGSKFFIAKGSGVIQAPKNSQSYIDSRVNAFNKAMLEAKKAMVEYLGVDIATDTAKEYAEGSAVNPPPPANAEEALVQELADKGKKLLLAKINAELEKQGIDPAKDPAAAKAALGKQLNSEKYRKMITSIARAKVLGLQACCTFEGIPANGKGEIGVVAIWSPKLQAMANSLVTGAPVPPVGAKRPVAQQISNDPATLISTFGVQQKIDETGDLVLVGFGQAGAISDSKMSGKAAQTKARQNAMAAIREFAGEQVAVATDTLNAETTEEFEKGAEAYENESAMKEKIAATAAKMNIAGIAPLKNYKYKHPINGKIVYGVAVTWCPKQAGQARWLKREMAKPPTPPSAPIAPGRPVQSPTAPSNSFHSSGDGADPDAI